MQVSATFLRQTHDPAQGDPVAGIHLAGYEYVEVSELSVNGTGVSAVNLTEV